MNRQTSIKHLPINLRKKAQRELRIRNGGFGRNRLKNIKKRQRLLKCKCNFECKELQALIKSTEEELESLLKNEPSMLDIPGDVTPEELEGEIALIKGRCTTVYVERDGLSTLKIMLPQEKPTIANLKRAIECKAQIQLKRELRECPSYHTNSRRYDTITTGTTIKPTATVTSTKTKTIPINSINVDNTKESDLKIFKNQRRQQRLEQQQITGYTSSAILNVSNNNNNTNNKETAIQSTGELVCSSTYNGHHHRSNISWRYLWRAYSLYNLNTKQPIKGDDGRQLLNECGIENETVLKFCKREKYFGRKRQ